MTRRRPGRLGVSITTTAHRMNERVRAGFAPVSVPNGDGGLRAGAVLWRCGQVATVVGRRGAAIAWHGVTATSRRQHIAGTQFYARQVRLGLEELGPTFVKLGQLLSTRSDVIPQGLLRELSMLRDHVSSVPTGAVIAELQRSVGSSVSEVFAAFDTAPVASASVGQVHRAVMLDGRPVAVKVRRPGIRSQIDIDVAVLDALTRMTRLSRTMRRYDPKAVVDEFSKLLRAETDYSLEAANIEAVGHTFVDDGMVIIPGVVVDLSSDSILVMDWIEGIPLTSPQGLKAAGVDPGAMARAIVHAYAEMILRSDRFHADPHPGNFIAMPEGRLGLVDFGEVGTVSAATRTALITLLVAVMSRDRDGLASAVLSISRVCRPVDRTGLGQELATLLDPIAAARLQDIKLGRVLRDLLRVLRSQGLMLPADLAVLVKTVIECESTANELDPSLSLSSFLSELGSISGPSADERGSSLPGDPTADSGRSPGRRTEAGATKAGPEGP
jgi:ubiquinone biosynthesis protein